MLDVFTKSKKGDGMSINVVVVAALALIVLIVLTAIFASKMQSSNKKGDVAETDTLNQICTKSGQYCEMNSRATCSQVVPVKTYLDCSGRCCRSSSP